MVGEAQELASRLGFKELNPMQEHALKQGFIKAERAIVAAPTASGKTLLALLAIANNFLKGSGKAVYIVPLKALASEKFREFASLLEQFNIKVGLSTGDLDSSSPELAGFDLVIATSEKMDSLLRHKAPWTSKVGLVVADEVHLLDDEERGATLEIVLTKFLQKNARIIGLSATIGNARELAEWLGAKLIESSYRPTRLVLGICTKGKLAFEEEAPEKLEAKNFLNELVEKALRSNNNAGQALAFVGTRKSTEATAQEVCSVTKNYLSEAEQEQNKELAEKILRVFSPPTKQCRLLAKCVASGTAFHHAGLPTKQRELIELGFKQTRSIKAIVCTTTLAMGIDYPASWVVVRDLKRFSGMYADYLKKLEVMQMLGRSGRPRYDRIGWGVLCCNPHESEYVKEKYVFGPIEDIYSKLSSAPALRVHCLALVATNYCKSFKDLFSFFSSTFYAFQYKDTERLFEKVEKVVEELKEMDFLRERNDALVATPVGKRVSELYLDPFSAYSFIKFIKSLKGSESAINYLLAICNTTELRPFLRVSRSEENALWEELYALLDDLALGDWEMDEKALRKYKLAKAFNAWINEEREEKMLEQFDLPPGTLFAFKTNAEWLCYSLGELAYLLNSSTAYKQARRLARRIKHGVKEELLDLCRVRGIGRIRARQLHSRGIRSVEQLKALPKEEVKKIIGGK